MARELRMLKKLSKSLGKNVHCMVIYAGNEISLEYTPNFSTAEIARAQALPGKGYNLIYASWPNIAQETFSDVSRAPVLVKGLEQRFQETKGVDNIPSGTREMILIEEPTRKYSELKSAVHWFIRHFNKRDAKIRG